MSVYQRTAAIASFCLVLGLGAAACGKKAPAADAAATRAAGGSGRAAGATRAARAAGRRGHAARAVGRRAVRAEDHWRS